MFNMYDVVIANEDLEKVPKRSSGAIVEVYASKYYEVEFVNIEGKTLNVLTVNEIVLEAAKGNSHV